MAEAIRVNFGRPMPVFPLPDAVLLPHAVQPLHIFESRYCQLVNDCLDGSGQIALACFEGRPWRKRPTSAAPSLRPAVCVGQIVQHEHLQSGRHNILLQGICRAVIRDTIEPEDERLYRLVRLEPLEAFDGQPSPMPEVREQLRSLLTGPRLGLRLRSVDMVMEWFKRDDVSTHALIELIGFALFRDSELKYRLLAEACAERRAGIITGELTRLDGLVARGDRQRWQEWPKGMSWN